MPSLNPIKIIGHATFMAKGLKLPVDWEQPSGQAAQQYADALTPQDQVAVPNVIPPHFMPHNPNRYHQDSCNKIGKAFKDMHDKAVDAVKFAHDLWRLQAKFSGLKIMAVSAIGQPGCLQGPALESFIKMAPSTAAMIGNEAKYRDAIAKGVSTCFKNWQDQVMVPGLPWYPAFAAFPGPMAPPMPNVPVPLIACISSQMAQIITPTSMKSEMINAFDSGLKQEDPDKQHEALFEAVATTLSLAFTMWLPMQQVMLVLGQGPIPTFAPPYVPVGPVVNGQNIPTPGCLIS